MLIISWIFIDQHFITRRHKTNKEMSNFISRNISKKHRGINLTAIEIHSDCMLMHFKQNSTNKN